MWAVGAFDSQGPEARIYAPPSHDKISYLVYCISWLSSTLEEPENVVIFIRYNAKSRRRAVPCLRNPISQHHQGAQALALAPIYLCNTVTRIPTTVLSTKSPSHRPQTFSQLLAPQRLPLEIK